MLRRSVRLLKEDTEAGVVLSLLLSTAILERSLGDVYLLRGFPCPSMLKDLLATSELQNIFGTTVIQLLQLVIGRPKSLNLRNISWHGFVSPGEVPTHYVWLLLCITASLGAILVKQGICLKDIPHRASITFPQTEVLKDVFPDLSTGDLPQLRLLFKESVFIPATMQPLWTLALDAFAENRYGECIVLLLPLLEHGMRCLYCLANHCHNRLLTAVNTVLFTTFDETLDMKDFSQNWSHEIINTSNSAVQMVLLDLLTYPEGPRLRDVISHGEVDLETCPRFLVRHLLGVFSALCHLAVPPHSTFPQESILQQIDQTAHSYQSRFHPISLLKKQIVETADSLSKWNTLQRPPEHEVETNITWQNPPGSATVCEAAQRLLEMSSFNSKHFAFISLVQPFDDIKREVVRMLAVPICTLYRGWSKQRNEEYISSAAKNQFCC
ncbi:hypothetical protein NP493_223g04017 [Ridgeia piscesae]|uniref:DUF4209 domain-containing protein n=1 Tax=Ridgeia piscesae TaxID=27915 RepID=A0AAD9UDW2_RIDPI|nr:hypothetical protein NP493_223g04017 [Ridgeia piscesae]